MTEKNKPYTTQAEFKSWSLKDAEPVTMQGFWNPENAPVLVRSLQEPPERKVVIQGETIHALGIDWWTWKTQFTATATANMGQQSDGMVTASMDFTPTSEAIMTKAEWWRFTERQRRHAMSAENGKPQ